jgi:RNA polymerase sigma-70 factor (ECF subfamily)
MIGDTPMNTPAPDWAALYQKHRNAMYGAALTVLARKAPDLANDAVNSAMVSLMENPPSDVKNWEALLVSTAKRRALDMVRSPAIARANELKDDYRDDHSADEDAIVRRLDAVARAKVAISKFNDQEHYVLNEYLVHQRDRSDVAGDLSVSPPRVSQIATKIQRVLRAALEEGG